MMLAAAIGAPTVRAQSASGDVRGTVVEQAGGPLAGVDIVVTNTATGMERRGMTTADGLFSVLGLPAGTYDVTATLDGFAQQRQEGVHIFVGQTVLSRLQLRRAALRETISLAPAPPTVEPLRSDVSSVITSFEIDHLPLSSRNVLDLVLLAPGVTGDISAGGQHETLNTVLVDGTDNTNSVFGQPFGRAGPGPTYQFSRDAIHDMHVRIGAAPAEQGGTGGAFVSIATRSGSNAFTGRLNGLYRDTALAGGPTAPEPGRPNGPLQAHQFGGTAGGPIARNRHFFLVSYDGLREKDERAVFLNLPDDTPPDALTAVAAAGLGGLASNWRRTRHQDVFLKGPITGLPMRIA